MKRRAMKRLWRVEVEWEDCLLHTDGWQPVKSHLRARRRIRAYSVGFVLADDEKGIVLASSVQGKNAAGVVTIPARQIIRRRRLR